MEPPDTEYVSLLPSQGEKAGGLELAGHLEK
jgi:hypothetical protein